MLPTGVTDENEVVTAAVNEKLHPEFNNDRHSKEVKIISYVMFLSLVSQDGLYTILG